MCTSWVSFSANRTLTLRNLTRRTLTATNLNVEGVRDPILCLLCRCLRHSFRPFLLAITPSLGFGRGSQSPYFARPQTIRNKALFPSSYNRFTAYPLTEFLWIYLHRPERLAVVVGKEWLLCEKRPQYSKIGGKYFSVRSALASIRPLSSHTHARTHTQRFTHIHTHTNTHTYTHTYTRSSRKRQTISPNIGRPTKCSTCSADIFTVLYMIVVDMV